MNTFTIKEQSDGDYRWYSVSSTSFRDRDREIVSTKALSDDCIRADEAGNYGPLLWWHMPSIVIGTCDFNMMVGKSLVESGTFTNPVIAKAIAANADTLALSIGFRHPITEPDADGVYQTIQRFERSILPADMASNMFTNLAVEAPMSIKANIKKLFTFRDLVGNEEEAEAFISKAIENELLAEEAGVASKEVGAADEQSNDAEKGYSTVTIESIQRETIDQYVADPPTPMEEYAMSEELCARIADMVVERLAPAFAATSQKATSEVAAVQEQIKSVQDQGNNTVALITSLKAELAAKEVAVGELATRIKSLEGDQPAGYVGGFQASTDPSTLARKEYSMPAETDKLPPGLSEQVDLVMKAFKR